MEYINGSLMKGNLSQRFTALTTQRTYEAESIDDFLDNKPMVKPPGLIRAIFHGGTDFKKVRYFMYGSPVLINNAIYEGSPHDEGILMAEFRGEKRRIQFPIIHNRKHHERELSNQGIREGDKLYQVIIQHNPRRDQSRLIKMLKNEPRSRGKGYRIRSYLDLPQIAIQ